MLSFKNHLKFPFSTNFNPGSLDAIQKDIDEIEINLKSNYNSLMVNAIEFRPLMEFSLNNLKYSKQKLNFIIMTIDRTEENLKVVNSLMDKINDMRDQIELVLRMRDLKNKADLKKIPNPKKEPKLTCAN